MRKLFADQITNNVLTLVGGLLMSLEHCVVDTDQVCDEQPPVNVVWDEELMHWLGSHI